jgi:uncharacterized caspase-like protein
MERETETNVIFLDACRDNPLARNLARAMGTRSTEIGRGLAATEAGVGTLISFSTQPGNVALDGRGRNSPFAGALVKRVGASNDDLSALLIDVRNDVRKETQNKQVPWEHSALTGRFYFNPLAQTAAPPQVAPARLSEAAEAWGAAERTTSVAALEAFITRYKDTFYAELARARAEELKARAAQPSAKDQTDSSEAATKLAALPTQPGPFDGTWTIMWKLVGEKHCKAQGGSYTFQIRNGVIAGQLKAGPVSGTVSPSGVGQWTSRSLIDGGTVRTQGQFRDNTASGTYSRVDGECTGTFTAVRD